MTWINWDIVRNTVAIIAAAGGMFVTYLGYKKHQYDGTLERLKLDKISLHNQKIEAEVQLLNELSQSPAKLIALLGRNLFLSMIVLFASVTILWPSLNSMSPAANGWQSAANILLVVEAVFVYGYFLWLLASTVVRMTQVYDPLSAIEQLKKQLKSTPKA